LAIKKIIALATIFFSFLDHAQADDAPSAEEVFQKVSSVYQHLKSFRFEGTVLRERKSEGFYEKREIPILKVGVNPDKLRSETGWPGRKVLTIFDGNSALLYFAKLNQYAKGSPSEIKSLVEEVTSGNDLTLAYLFAAQYENLGKWAKSARILREEVLEINGQPTPCYVMEIPAEPGSVKVGQLEQRRKTLWVDKERFLVLKEVSVLHYRPSLAEMPIEATETILLSQALINGPIPDDQFDFVPPSGAMPLGAGNEEGGREAGLLGKEAGDFALKSLEGMEFNLKKTQGQLVLLEFWATWCQPCRIEMPIVEKLHRELKAKGLVVLGINDENEEQARQFLRENHISFPTLMDTAGLHRYYQVQAIPTLILIDRAGKVAWHHVGTSNEAVLRKALLEAGLK
jgi:thiol-disulfide isomerase/thioredoxin/outer membrane lipoprotein-sorting protein